MHPGGSVSSLHTGISNVCNVQLTRQSHCVESTSACYQQQHMGALHRRFLGILHDDHYCLTALWNISGIVCLCFGSAQTMLEIVP